jgi:DMSO/TMAO reductase YedYZ heme-binding membrane subunit
VVALSGLVAQTNAGATSVVSIIRFLDFYCGVFTLLALTGTVVGGLVAMDRMVLLIRHRVLAQELHRAMAVAAIGLLVVHVLVKVLEQHVVAVAAIVPFTSPGNAVFIGLGTIAAHLMILVTATGIARGRFAGKARPGLWRALHGYAYVAWPVAVMHGLSTGRQPAGWVTGSYLICLVLVGCALALRLVTAWYRHPTMTRFGPPVGPPVGTASLSGTSSGGISLGSSTLASTSLGGTGLVGAAASAPKVPAESAGWREITAARPTIEPREEVVLGEPAASPEFAALGEPTSPREAVVPRQPGGLRESYVWSERTAPPDRAPTHARAEPPPRVEKPTWAEPPLDAEKPTRAETRRQREARSQSRSAPRARGDGPGWTHPSFEFEPPGWGETPENPPVSVNDLTDEEFWAMMRDGVEP